MTDSFCLLLVRGGCLALFLVVSARASHPYTFYHYAPYHVARPNTSPACWGSLPCYNVVLTYVSDGNLALNNITKEQDFLDHFAITGDSRDDVIAEGRRAAEYYRQRHGIDFTYLSDDAFLSGKQTNHEGVTFRPYTLKVEGRYRLYMGAIGDQAQVFNRQISDAGWIMSFKYDTYSRGSFTGLIPQTAYTFFGSYIIKPCDDKPSGYNHQCQNILNPANPTAPIKIKFRTLHYLGTHVDPLFFQGLNLAVEHPVWGVGGGRGYLPKRFDGSKIIDGRTVLTFPSYL